MKVKPIHLLHLALFSVLLMMLGCDILGINTEKKCSGKLDSVSTTATLGGFEDDYLLSTPTTGVTADSAILSAACPATFSMIWGYSNPKVQYARAGKPSLSITQPPPYQTVPLTNYQNAFHVNSELITFTATAQLSWTSHNGTESDTVGDFKIEMTDHGDYPGSGSRGKFFIKTSRKTFSLDPDSTIRLKGKILYYH